MFLVISKITYWLGQRVQPFRVAISKTARDAPPGRPQAARTTLASRNRFTRRHGSGASPPRLHPSTPGVARPKRAAVAAAAPVPAAGSGRRTAAIPSFLPAAAPRRRVRFRPAFSWGHSAIRRAGWQPHTRRPWPNRARRTTRWRAARQVALQVSAWGMAMSSMRGILLCR